MWYICYVRTLRIHIKRLSLIGRIVDTIKKVAILFKFPYRNKKVSVKKSNNKFGKIKAAIRQTTIEHFFVPFLGAHHKHWTSTLHIYLKYCNGRNLKRTEE